MITTVVSTWWCENCDYSQDFEMTKESADIHFNRDRNFAIHDLLDGECPSCRRKLVLMDDLSRMTTENTLEREDLNGLPKEELRQLDLK